MRLGGPRALNRLPGAVRRLTRGGLNLAEGLGLVLVSLALASSWFGWSSPLPLVLFAGVLPFWMAAAFAVAVVAGFRRHWLQLGAAIVLLGLIAALTVPAVRSTRTPPEAQSATRLRVFTSNLFVSNNRYDEMADAIMAADADVIVLVELTPWFVGRLRSRGLLERYPNQMLDPHPDSTGTGILARVPVAAATMRTIGPYASPAITVQLDGHSLVIVAAHPFPPSSSTGAKPWTAYLDALHRYAVDRTNDREDLVVTGDFNATRWHRPFRRLLDGSLRDAHESVGKGLSMSWPAKWLPLRIMRLDHLLASPKVGVVKVDNIVMPGSDHTAFVAELVITG